MRQFVVGSHKAFEDLRVRAQGACVVFKDQEMPPGTLPPTATVGFEVDPCDGSALLLVKGVEGYHGESEQVRQWLLAGQLSFASFGRLREWIKGELASCFRVQDSGQREQQGQPRPALSPNVLTDLPRVLERISRKPKRTLVKREVLLQEMHAQIRGQDEALRTLSGRVCRHIARPKPIRPLTLFAIGPTGVGKTRTAMILASSLASLDPGAGFRFLRLDMSEYREPHRISQLLGAPQGYIGYGEGAQLVDTLGMYPRAVVLFDEIEKAHPDILRSLMNAMDAGRLSSASGSTTRGREIDCRGAIFIFTSNLDCETVLKDLEDLNAFGYQALVDEVCRERFRAAGISPELIGRINCFLVFRGIGSDVLVEIVTLAIVRAAQEYDIEVVYMEPEVVARVLQHSPKTRFGVRPYEYLIDELLGEALAEAASQGIREQVRICAGPPIHCVSEGKAAARVSAL